MKTEEEKKERQRQYYQKNKEHLRQLAKEYYAKKTANKPKKAAMTKEERRIKAREKYRREHNIIGKMESKSISKEYEKKHKGFKFNYDNGIISFEVKLPFRVQIDKYDAKHTDEETYTLLYRELKHKLRAIDPTQTIFIMEPEYVQFFSANIEAMDKVVEAVKEFIKEKTEIYGKYKFRGRYIGAQF